MCREMSKGTSQCFQPPSKSQSRRLPVESAMPGTTLQTIQLKAFASGGCLFGKILLSVGFVIHQMTLHTHTHTSCCLCLESSNMLATRPAHQRVCCNHIRITHVACCWLHAQCLHALIPTNLRLSQIDVSSLNVLNCHYCHTGTSCPATQAEHLVDQVSVD